jgi:hypothetical protein
MYGITLYDFYACKADTNGACTQQVRGIGYLHMQVRFTRITRVAAQPNHLSSLYMIAWQHSDGAVLQMGK